MSLQNLSSKSQNHLEKDDEDCEKEKREMEPEFKEALSDLRKKKETQETDQKNLIYTTIHQVTETQKATVRDQAKSKAKSIARGNVIKGDERILHYPLGYHLPTFPPQLCR